MTALSKFEDSAEFVENNEPRCPCLLVLDTSTSMRGAPISELNEGLRVFADDLRGDSLARLRVEVGVLSFGGSPRVEQPFVVADDFYPPMLSVQGATPMGAAMCEAIRLVRERTATYKAHSIPYYRPWVWLLSDGAPTDSIDAAVSDVAAAHAARGLVTFAVGVGPVADLDQLARFTEPGRPPVRLAGLAFAEMFLWLSASQKAMSQSPNTSSLPADQQRPVPLPPVTWAQG